MSVMKISPGDGFEEELEKTYWGRVLNCHFKESLKKLMMILFSLERGNGFSHSGLRTTSVSFHGVYNTFHF